MTYDWILKNHNKLRASVTVAIRQRVSGLALKISRACNHRCFL